MKNFLFKLSIISALLSFVLCPISRAEEGAQTPEGASPASVNDANATDATATPEKAKEDNLSEEAPAPASSKTTRSPKRTDRADAFVAGADWEFDGFVAGGQDSDVRSMFYLNDLIYINVGSQQGLATGDKIGIYKRGDRVRDPQTGKFIGYEVRRAAIAHVTDRVEDEVTAVRITNTYEPVEIGDLVRREQ